MTKRNPADELRAAVERNTPPLLALSEADSARRPAPGKWSPREVIGHLIDSASHNHQRFVRAQFEDDLVFPGYNQDEWVRVQQYHEARWEDLVMLWRVYNLHLVRLMAATPVSVRTRPRTRHNLDEIAWRPVVREEAATLDYFMGDYVDHLNHHLRQILG